MTRRRQQADDPLERVAELLEAAPPGLHDLRPIEDTADAPVPLAELYVTLGAGTLFHEALELCPPDELSRDPELGIRFGAYEGDDLWLDARGRVRRFDPALDDVLVEGSRLDRWLWGLLEGYRHVLDHEGEFVEDAFDEHGELTRDCALRQLAAQLRRDPQAVALRLRRATLLAAEDLELARAELEEVAHLAPELPWGWLELAKISESKGELTGALEEVRTAAECAERADHPQAGYLWAQAARLCSALVDEPGRAAAAAKVHTLAPELKAAQLAGALAELEDGELAAASRLAELLVAVWPRDLEVLDLRRKIEARAD
ncbi:MAG: hypothetical protein R3B48_06220 [Kofleriaceae bacterium]